MVRVLFVCLGNICRSPTAEGVFRQRVADAGLSDRVVIDSAGTGAWHVGSAPDARAQAAALRRGVDLSGQRARQVCVADFHDFDFVLAMDGSNLAELRALAPGGHAAHLGRFLEFAPAAEPGDVPDPYYGGEDGFEAVLDLIGEASDGLLTHLRQRLEGAPR